MVTYSLYLITNKVNGKRYAGQTKGTIEDRFDKHKYDAFGAKRGFAIHAAMRKYGVENFEIKLLSVCYSLKDSNHREAYYIKLFNTLAPNGYNLRPGGDNSAMSQETKKKLSESRMGEKHHFFGKHFTDSHKKNLSISHTGRGLGRKMPEETKLKISQANSGCEITQEHRDKISKTLTGVPQTKERKENIRIAFWKSDSVQSRIDRLIEEGLKTAKPVLCHQNGKTYKSTHEAARELGLQRQHIKGTIDGKAKFTKGYSFEYVK